jgi:DNA-binding beta-propeller fold protein YncE
VTDVAAAASPDGKLVFVGHNSSDTVEAFLVNNDGSVVTPGSTVTSRLASIAPHPTLPIIYSSDLGSVITPPYRECHLKRSSYNNVTGALTFVASVVVADECRGMAVSPDGQYVVTTHILGRIQIHTLDSNGAIISSASHPISGGRPVDVVFDPTGSYFYVADLDQGIFAFSFNSGTPTVLASPYAVGFTHDSAMSPENLLVVTTLGQAPFTTDIRRFQVGAGGLLTSLPVVTILNNCQNSAITKDGRTLLLTCRDVSQIRSYQIDPVTFALTEAAGSPYAVADGPRITSNLVVRD